MHGFIAVVSKRNKLKKINFCWKPVFDFQPEYINNKFDDYFIQSERFCKKKFVNEKVWMNNEKNFAVVEGIITNLNTITEKYKLNSKDEVFELLINNPEIINEFSGSFAGFVYSKNDHVVLAFTNHTSTKKLFYFNNDDYLLVSTDLFTLSKALDSLNIKKTLDIKASYFLLSSGFMHDNYTLIAEVKQVRAGEYIFINKHTIRTEFYFNLNNIKSINDSPDEIIIKLNKLFNNATRNEYSIDNQNNKVSVTTLSGGLDSRMTALIAFKSGYKNQHLINFSEKGYADQSIALEIAKKYNIKIQTTDITSNSLYLIDETILVNDGLTLFLSSNLLMEVLPKFRMNDMGMLHTGILGDAIFGSYLKSTKRVKASYKDGNYAKQLPKKAHKYIEESIKEYDTEELYKFYNRGFLGINNGFLYYDLVTESFSPFLDPEFLQYVLSIPRKLRFKEKIYIDWIKTHHPDISNFVWENIGCKPTNNKIIRFYYRLRRAIIKRLPIKSIWKNSMNPEQLWYDSDPQIKVYFDEYYNTNINKFAFDNALMEDMIKLYNTGRITEKTQVLTLLGAYKLLFE